MGKGRDMLLYNSMTKQKEIFKPKIQGKDGMYMCGVTAYDFSHIGHARAYVAFDVLYRYLIHKGFEVTYVRNFTDVDDKIINRAKELGEPPLDLSDRFCKEFLDDMKDLQCLDPTHQPRVSENMEEIKDMIAKIIKNGFAYEVDGDVYFSVDKSPNYGQLSGRKLEDNRAGERIVIDSRKRNPADFALWKAAKPGEPCWQSPWGSGRPGWHIECSAMSARYLSYSFDIHGGGMDLIFPHHENELAQSCAACPETNVSYWVHNGFVTANDEKMSKSLGNFFTIREVTKLYHPLVLRYFLMSTHYRSPVNYSLAELDIASDSVFYIYQSLQNSKDASSLLRQANQQEADSNDRTAEITKDAKKCISRLGHEFENKLSDDLHTPDILKSSLKDSFRLMNSYVGVLEKNQQNDQHVMMMASLIELEKEVKEVLRVLGLLSTSYAEVVQQLKGKALTRAGLTEDDVLCAIAERAQARELKDFKRSDEIRSEFAKKGISLMDRDVRNVWRPQLPA